ncbi:T9SS type A sorting domain-containing protein [Flavobacterium sp. LHD-85]|uniref:T9SS type A sorting domain-containing protein n=1 Tax=Flavobacterium sp. LHD-85 TaxID=3071410 RepID=UPI0027DF29E8|nr:T9SS type A sorting domain-containing protein [Flavobacterium sp. LHD-85]MDQ6529340.1 T9SS type A sorting domain-containing protein [Flavobacterium sp. LHD-85]
MLKNYLKLSVVVAAICLITPVNKIFAQNPIVKIDFDQSGRPKAEVNDPDYTAWVIASGNTSTYTENGVTFTITRVGNNGDNLGTNWYKAGIQAPYYARLVCDGLTVKGTTANLGAQIELKISGLATGEHTVLAFFNNVDSPTTNTFSPIDISVNGNLVVDNLIPSVRATKTADAKSAYLKFQATAGTDVVILMAAKTSGTENIKNFIFNGFELNTPNIFYQATNPSPKQNDEHVELTSGGKLLQWAAAANAVSHNIYFGTDQTAVDNATTSSPEFKGNQALASNSYQVNGLYTGATYYWRIDEVLANGVEKGNVWRFRPAQLAFPEAEGYGRFARGGRGGKVVAVTNLNDSGPGSFREAVTNDIGPRTIVFNTSGVIQLQSRLVLSQPYVTVAGQTAPGKGICIRSAPFGVTGNDAVVQNLRVRVGAGPTYDGMGLTGADNSIIDHCSISWTIDESFSSRSGKNITLQRTLISEALNAANHQNYPAGTEHGYAATIGGDIGSFHHNLLAHCYGRNWSLGGGLDGSGAYTGRMDITNNVVYNWGGRTTDGGTKEVNFVNNYYKPGAGSKIFVAFNQQNEGVGTGMQRCYFNGNVMPGYFDENNQTLGRKASGNTVPYDNFVNTPFFPSYVTTQSAKNAYKIVLSDVGCTQPEFDDHDQRIISETLNGTYSAVGSVTGKPGFPDNEADVGGFESYPAVVRHQNWDTDQDGLPNWWENIIGTNVNSAIGDFSDANADPDLDGYTNLDKYLQWMSEPHYDAVLGNKTYIDIQKLSRGFTNGVSYSLSQVVNGNATLSGNTVEFKPNAKGLCSFKFTVTDAEGGTMTRKVNILSGYTTSPINETIKELIDNFKVWPVPNTGNFSILLDVDVEQAELRIYNIFGREVQKRTISGQTQENISITEKGIYILKVTDPDTKKILYLKKVIIQ